jgi:hypothetical protein
VGDEEHPSDVDWDEFAEDLGLQHKGELGDKLAVALALQPVSHTVRLVGVRRRWWWWWRQRLLPGKRCPNCGARLQRIDPDGQPSRVWWCREHGPWERPDAAD